uniref:Uncharacterized protein n=1 Tax=Oryza sativa subsp. japonica TaxID=39947 RepID=Q53K93_ORYSJ|nr:hypothetical protein LOC_Os11g22210 [Oryza sativa Japonica Group]ABA93065.1 hypothetical protein LOC_Os11g22210 [Oryza sativa Japonica Group]
MDFLSVFREHPNGPRQVHFYQRIAEEGMDLDKSTSTSASLKKLQEEGALPGRGTMEREPGGLNSETVGRRVGQVMISGPTTVSNVPVPLCEKGAAEREAAINASDASPPPPRRQWLVTLGENLSQGGAGEDNARRIWRELQRSPVVASTDVVVVPTSREATPSGPVSDLVPAQGPPADIHT